MPDHDALDATPLLGQPRPDLQQLDGEPDLQRLAEAMLDERLAEREVAPSRAGKQIGPYRLERELGHGGMGVVYLASRTDNQFKKKVAIKLLNYAQESTELVKRFQNERQIHACLDHPNICRLYDGGLTDDGAPYFIMEYLRDAVPLDEYCRTKGLALVERLELFRRACAAVQYAHRFLIVHRDLKPSNILVTAEGEVKLMDFGIAKNLMGGLMGEERWKTIGAMPMTPAYASPEQVRGEAISTSSDVYSLGVVLYELLTGMRPFQDETTPLPELLQNICENDPPRPSTAVRLRRTGEEGVDVPGLARHLRGDLDWIVLMALRKDPLRRYASVEQLSEDVGRYLEGRPVIARKDTPGYRLQKFIGRHKVSVCAALLVIAALAGGVVSTRREQAQTRLLFDDVRHLANSLLFEVDNAIRDLPGSTHARLLLVKSAVKYLDKLSQRASGDVSLQNELAEAYRKIGEVQYHVGGANLGDISGSLESAWKELGIRESIVARDQTVDTRRELATAVDRVSDLLEGTGSTAESMQYLNRALEMREALHTQYPGDTKVRNDLAAGYRAVADRETKRANPKAAVEMHRRALEVRRALVSENPKDMKLLRQLSMDLVRIGDTLGSPNSPNLGQFEEAKKTYEEALAIRESLRAATPGSVSAARDVCNVQQREASLLIEMKKYDESLERSNMALAILEKFWVADPANFEIRRDMAVLNMQIGRAQAKMKSQKAEGSYRRALAIYKELQEKNPRSDRSQEDLAGCQSSIGQLLTDLGQFREAEEQLRLAGAGFDSLVKRHEGEDLYERKRLKNLTAFADLYAKSGRKEQACAAYRESVALGGRLKKADRLSAYGKADQERMEKALGTCP